MFDIVKFKKPRKTVAAAVRIEPELYAHALRKAEVEDSNFSRYVRGLVRADLKRTGYTLPSAEAAS